MLFSMHVCTALLEPWFRFQRFLHKVFHLHFETHLKQQRWQAFDPPIHLTMSDFHAITQVASIFSE